MAGEVIRTLVVVDDDWALLRTLGKVLERTGHRVLLADTPAEALALLDAGGVDLLLSDLDMPEMSGVELLTRVRASHPDVVRMLLTGGATLDSALRAINEGQVHRYLTKPCDNDALRKAVEEALAQVDAHRQNTAAERQRALQLRMLGELEREHPGIAVLTDTEGERRLDAGRLDGMAASLEAEALRAFFSV